MFAQRDKAVSPPIDFWGSRLPAEQGRPAARATNSDAEPAWNELVTWFEQHKDWMDLVSQIESTGD
jgi:hypothetical protein